MPRGNPSGVRSGRINSPTATNPVISTKKETSYRFSNTGKTLFKVKYTVEGTDPTIIEVKQHCSVDVDIPEDVKVYVVGANATGVFDQLQNAKPARGGKFKIPANGVPSDILIAKRLQKGLYRIFNGGEIAIQTVPAPANVNLAEIPPRSSRDVAVPEEVELKIANAAPKVSGAFDTVNSADIRSGRFVFKAGAGADHWDYLIADLSGLGSAKQTYRITNTGDLSFKVFVGTNEIATLATDQSVDVQFPGGNANSVVRVRAAADSEILTGIYDNI